MRYFKGKFNSSLIVRKGTRKNSRADYYNWENNSWDRYAGVMQENDHPLQYINYIEITKEEAFIEIL